MKEEKAYKLLALQEEISNKKAKELIDKGVVYVQGKKLNVARTPVEIGTVFKLEKLEKITVIDEDKDVLVLNKPAFYITEDVGDEFGYPPLHRLDKETSGVLILAKNEEFRLHAIEEFKKRNVIKTYYAIIAGKFAEAVEVNSPILTTKTPHGAFSKISQKGKEAKSLIEPVMIEGRYSLVKVTIPTGRTHQIRVHLQSIAHPILGDNKYGGKTAERIMLHSQSLSLLGKTYTAPLPSIFRKYGFSI